MIYVVEHHDRKENTEYHLIQSAHKWLIYNTGHAYQISKRDIAEKRNDGIDGDKNVIHAASFQISCQRHDGREGSQRGCLTAENARA